MYRVNIARFIFLLASVHFSALQQLKLDDGICRDIKRPPVGFYPFHQDTAGKNIYGDSATEASLNDVTYAKDIDGTADHAVYFKGKPSSYIQIPRNPLLDTAKDISIVFNVLPQGEEGELFSYKTTGGGVQISQFKGEDSSLSVINIRFVKRNLRLVDDLQEACLENGQWNMIAVTYNYQSGDASLYKNGKLLKTINLGSNYIATQFSIRVGALEYDDDSPFKGGMSCLQIYNYTMDLEQVKQSQYACRKASIVIPNTSVSIVKPEFPEPNTPIKFKISQELNDVHIIADFNDGSAKYYSKEREITHRYKSPGPYNPTVTICLGCQGNNIRFQEFVRIYKNVEKPEGLSVEVNGVLFGGSTNLTATLDKGSDFNCTWRFGDDSQEKTTQYNGNLQQNLQHQYQRSEIYTGHVTCFNRKATLTETFKIDVQQKIRTLQINDVKEQLVTRAFQVSWKVAQGNPINYKVTINGKNQEFNLKGLVGEAFVQQSTFDGQHGVYKMKVEVSNKVTETITKEIEIVVHPFINPVSIVVPKHIIEVNETLSFIANSENTRFHGYPRYDWEFGDGSPIYETVDGNATYKYVKDGKSLVKLTTHNPVSSHLSMLEVTVLRPVLKFENLKCVSSPSFARRKVELQCNLTLGSDFTCTVDWDGEGKTTHDFSHLKYYIEQSTSKNAFQNITFVDSYYLAQPKHYLLGISCTNRINRVDFQTTAIVQDMIENLKISAVEPQVFGKSFRVNWEITSGTEVEYSLHWNDKEIDGLEFVDGKPSITINESIYMAPGVHTFKLEAWNLVSSPLKKTMQIIIERPISAIEFNIISQRPNLEVFENATYDFEAQDGDNPNYRITFGDRSPETVTNDNSIIRAYTNYGEFEVTIEAFNNVSKTTTSKTIKVLKPVLRLGNMVVTAPHENVSEPVDITVMISQGSDYTCNIKFGDGNERNTSVMYGTYFTNVSERIGKKYSDIKMIVSHPYNQVKIYIVNVICANRLNSVSATAKVAIFKPVVPFNIILPETSEQNSVIGIEISHENDILLTKHDFFIDFGDNEKLRTTLNRVEHVYDQFGTYDITVTAENPVSRIEVSKAIVIMKPVVVLQGLSVSSVPVNLTKPTVLLIKLKEGSDFNCSIQWLANHKTVVNKMEFQYYNQLGMDAFQNIQFEADYIFENEGHHNVEVTCYNRRGSLSADVTVFTQILLEGFHLKPCLPQVFGKDFYIYYHVRRGSDLTFSFLFNGDDGIDVIQNERRILISADDYPSPGVYEYQLTGSNLVSGSITVKGRVVIDEAVRNVSVDLEGSSRTVEVNQTINLSVLNIGGSSVLFCIKFGDGNEIRDSKDSKYSHVYRMYGTYKIQVSAYNNVSKVHATIITIMVQKPVLPLLGLRIEAPLHMNISQPYQLQLQLQQGSDFECTVNLPEGILEKIRKQKESYYTKTPRWSTEGYTQLSIVLSHVFSRIGEHVIKANCSNRLYEIEAETRININLPLPEFSIAANKNEVEINETIVFTITDIDPSMVPVFVIKDGKYTPELKTSSFQFQKSFSHYGTFQLVVNATNPTSTKEKSIEITVLKPVIPLQGLQISTRPTNLTKVTTLDLSLQKGSDFVCTINWGDDEIEEEVNFEDRYSFYSKASLDETPFTDLRIPFEHIYKEIGEYNIRVNCLNRKNQLETDCKVNVQIPISGFQLHAVKPQRFGSSFQLGWDISKGSNVEYLVIWDQKSVPYEVYGNETRATITTTHYTQDNIYKYTVCAKNLVSVAGNLSGHVIVEKHLQGLDVLLSKSKEVEVNETITLSVSLESGNNPHFKYDTGAEKIPQVETQSKSLDFEYTKQGEYTVKVYSWNNVSRIEGEVTVNVIKPVLPITKVDISTSKAYETSKTTNIKVIVESGSDFKCSILFGDGTQEITETINQHFYQNGHLENMVDFHNVVYSFKHNYTAGDTYDVQVTCSNRVSSQTANTMVMVQGKIENIEIIKLPAQRVGEVFTVNFHATRGTNITYFIHFQDQVFHHHSHGTEMQTQTLSSEKPGTYRILVNATNHISGVLVSSIDVNIEEPISGLEIYSPIAGFQLEVKETFEFCYTIGDGSSPNFTSVFDGRINEKSVKLKMVDGKPIICLQDSFDGHGNFTLGEPYLDLELKIIAENRVSKMQKSLFVKLLKPVLEVKFTSLECGHSITNQESTISLVLSGSDFTCVWRLQNKAPEQTESSDVYLKDGHSEISEFVDIIKTHSSVYGSPGAYQATVECKNRHSTGLLNTVCLVQDAITGIEMIPMGSKLLGASHNVSWATQSGTNVTYMVKLNNKVIDTIYNNNGVNSVTLPSDIVNTPGDVIGVIIASNLVTENYEKQFVIRFEKELEINHVKITYDGQTGEDQIGHGDGSYFPTNREITFETNTNTEDFDIEWSIVLDSKQETESNQKFFNHKFLIPGKRIIKYRVFNNISSVNGEKYLTFIEPVGYIILSSNSPKWIGFTMNFTIYMPEKGQETCFKFEAGDGSVYYYTTENGDCNEFYSNVTKVHGVFPKYQDSMQVAHRYRTWSFYTAKVTASNHLSTRSSKTIVLASEVICNFPKVNITNLGPSPFYPTRLQKSGKMTVYLDVELDCEYISKSKYEWKIYKYNEENGKLKAVKFENKTDYGFNPYIQREFVMKKKVLSYGIYLIKATVTMNDPKAAVFNTVSRGYLQIYPSPLVAAVKGGTLIRRGVGETIKISGGDSYDPDINKNNFTGMNFTWFCFNAMESVPDTFKHQFSDIPNYKVAVLKPLEYDADVVKKGGCYGNGTYHFNTPDENFNLDTNKMIAEQTYVLFVILQKDRRLSLGYQAVELVNGLPPVLGIVCAENCLEKINPSGKFALMGKCTGKVCDDTRLQYEWEVYMVKNVTSDGKIIWELDTTVMKAVEQYRKGLVFVIKKFTLTPEKLYRFTLIGGLADGAKGLSQRNGFTNLPPTGGRCYSDVEVGEAMETEFTFTCEGWDDPDTPLRYEFVYYNEEGGESLFLFGPSNVAKGKLPIGPESNNYTIKVDVRIIDVFEAAAVTTFNITVVEPKLSEDEMIGKLLNMTQGENSQLEVIVNSGDTQAIAKLMNAITSILNKKSESAGKRKQVRSKMLAQLSLNGTLQINGSVIFHNGTVLHSNETAVLGNGTVVQKNGTVLHPNGTMFHNGTWMFGNNTGFNITELTAEQQRQRDREAIRAAMISALSNQKATSLEAMRQNADVMGSLTKSKSEVNAAAQEASASSMMGMTSQLSGESSGEDGAGSDAVEGVAGTMASGLGNLLGSASGSAKPKVISKPTTTTAPSTTVSIMKFEGLFDDDEEDTQVSEDDDDYVETDPTKLKAQQTVAGVFSAAGSVGNSMTGNKLPGEESTIIDSPSMAMSSGQVDPGKMGAPVCSPGGAGFKMPVNGNLFKNAGNSTNLPAVGQQMMALKDNPFTWDPKGGVSGTVTSVSLNSGGGSSLNVDGTDEPMEITMPREGEADPPTLVSFAPDTQKYVYHKVEIEKNNTAVTAHIIPQNHTEQPFNGTVMLAVYVRRKLKPTKQKHDWFFIFPRETNETYDACNPAPPEANYTLFLSDMYLSKGVYWIGVSYLPPPGMLDEALVNTTLNYTLRIFTSQCKYWNENKNKWMTDGCHVGPKTDLTKTHCLCTHLTSFGGGLMTAPAPIDFSKVFAGFKDMFASGNVGVFFTIIGMFGFYILLAVYSRRMDKKEEAQMGVTPIFNVNEPDANYQYEITFYTNRGSKAGTSAQIFMNIVGSKGESGPLPLKDAERSLFLPGAINSFLAMVPNSLGDIKNIRIWHDNGGYSPSWNLQKVTMRDLQTNEPWIFLGGWWALDEGEFQIDKTIKPATEADLADFKVLFQEKLMKELGDAHIWFSIFLRPPTSRFTRLQRLSCCLTILCLTMVSSAMFFGAGPASAGDDANALAIGPIKISLKMIIVGVQSSIVVVPPTVLIVFLFASARRRHAISIEGSLKKAREKQEREENGEENDEDNITTICCCFKRKRPKRQPKNKKPCFRCCRRGQDSDDSEFEEFDSISGEDNGGYDKDERAQSRQRKPRIRGYYSSSDDDGCSEGTYVSSSDELDTSPETEEEEPILDNEEILAIENESSQILIDDEVGEEEGGKENCFTKLYHKVTKKKELTPEKKLEQERKEVEALEKQLHGSLPWWVIYPAWVLVFLGSTLPALFTLFYSMMWGKTKSNAWLTTQALSFFQDTFVSRPIKIIAITTIVAMLMKKKPKAKESMPAEPLQGDETLITSGLEHETKENITAMCKPPNAKKVAMIREVKLKEKRMSAILKEMAYFIFYILLLFLVSAGNRDIWAYKQREVIDRLLVNGGSTHTPMMKISDVNDVHTFWKYVNETFIPSMYYEEWYNGLYYNYTAFAMLRETKRLGITRLRQVRTKQDTCEIHPEFVKHIKHCNGKYSMNNEDQKWYKPGWSDPKERSGKQRKRFSPWKHASGKESRNIIPVMANLNTYMGGGYLGELGVNTEYSLMYESYMQKYNWIDKNTRGVFLEFTLYNPNLNLVSVGMLMFEFFNFGGALPKAEIYVSRLYRNLVPTHKILLAFDIVFFFFTLYSLFRECRNIKQQRKAYFKSLNNCTNLVLVFLGICVMGTYAMRSLSLGSKIAEFLDSPHLFISFYQNAMYHELVAVLMSCIDFIAMIKFLTFLQFNRNFLTLIQTIVRAGPKLILFCLYISLWVMAFVIFSYLLLGTERFNFSSLQRSIYSLNLLLLGVFDWEDFMSRPSVGPYLFMFYCIIMTFMMMNIFLTILMEVYAQVQMDEELKKREFHVVEFLMESFMLSIGIKKPLGLGDDDDDDVEVKFRKKDPYIHRMNRFQRSIEERKTPKINKMINKMYADELMEDLEMLSLELMTYPDEFFDLIPCSIKVKLQTMLRRGEIDEKTYCDFMEISMAGDDAMSVCSKSSLGSQQTLNFISDISSSEDPSSLTNSLKFLAEETDSLTSEQSTIAPSIEEEYLEQYANETVTPRESKETFTPRESAILPESEEDTDEKLSDSNQSFDLSIPNEDSNAQLVLQSDRKRRKSRVSKPPEFIPPTNQQESSIVQKQTVTSNSQGISYLSRDVPYLENHDHLFNPNTDQYLDDELRAKANTDQQNVDKTRKYSPQTSIDIDLLNASSSRQLLGESTNAGAAIGGGTVVSARRKKSKKKNTSNV